MALADSVGNHFLGGVARVSTCSPRARVGDPLAAQAAFAALVEDRRRGGAWLHEAALAALEWLPAGAGGGSSVG